MKYLTPPLSEAILFHNVGLWLDGKYRCNLVLANVRGVKEPWGVITDEEPNLKTLWQYGIRFRVEQLFLDSKSGAFQLEESRIRSARALERLYLIVAVSLLFATVYGMNIQVQGLRRKADATDMPSHGISHAHQAVDPHWSRGLSYLKIGLRWLKGVLHKGRDLLTPLSLLRRDPEPCFASKKAQRRYYDAIWFTRISEIKCAKI